MYQRLSLLLIFFAASNFARAAVNTAPFDLVKKGAQVCKVTPGSPNEVCYASVEDPNVMGVQFPATIGLLVCVLACNGCVFSDHEGIEMTGASPLRPRAGQR